MSSTNNNGERGITLKSLADLGSVIDLQTLPPGPEPESTTHDDAWGLESSADLSVSAPQDLAGLLAQLASLSGGLESMARQDARAREQATLELAQYETVLAERQDAERALVEARRLRAGAEQLAAEAFSDEARAQAAQHAAVVRAAELSCTQFLAERTRVADELASRPHMARAIAERRRLAQQQAEAIERAEAERASRFAQGVAAVRAAVGADQLDRAARLLAPLTREFAQDTALENRPARSQGIAMKLLMSKRVSGQSYLLALRCGRRADMFSRMR
jgi:hypothetical protein